MVSKKRGLGASKKTKGTQKHHGTAMRLLLLFFLAVAAVSERGDAYVSRSRLPRNNNVADYALRTSGRALSNTKSRVIGVSASALHGGAAAAAAAAVSGNAGNAVQIAALKAIAKLISTCAIGVGATKMGILDKSALSVLSKLVFNLFQPCLLFGNVARTVSKSQGNAALWILPCAASFQIMMGFLIGKLITLFIYRGQAAQDSEECKQTLTCTTFSNSGPLPLVFVEALLKNFGDGSLMAKGTAYVSLYLLGWSPLFWIFAPAILSEKRPAAAVSTGKGTEQEKKDMAIAAAAKRKELLNRIFSPPVIGSLMGLVVGSVPFLKHLVLDANGLLNPIFEAMHTLGAAYLPAVLLVLAGSLFPAKEEPAVGSAAVAAVKEDPTKAAEAQKAFFTQIFAVYVARYFVSPLIGFSSIQLIKQYFPATRAIFHDKLLVLILLLETCMPSAQNSTVILQLQKKSAAAARMARVLMAVYILGIPALTFWIAKVLSASGIMG